MCLAIPGKIVEIDGVTARVDFGGVTREADLSVMPDVEIGDYVLVHAGFAIQKLDASEAGETLRIFDELARTLESEDDG